MFWLEFHTLTQITVPMGTVLVFTMNSKGGNQPKEHSEKCGYNGSHKETGTGSNARYSSTSHTAHQMLWLPAENQAFGSLAMGSMHYGSGVSHY